MTASEVPVWNMGKLKSFHPQLTLTSSAPLAEVLTLLEAGLRDASFKVKKRSATGFQARYIDWMDLVAGGLNKTTLDVASVPGADSTEVVVTGKTLDSDKGGRRKAAQGLSTAVEALLVRGFEVSTTPWRAADSA
jgi:hypothetical protein